MTKKEALELAKGLQNSNYDTVAMLGRAYIELHAENETLHNRLFLDAAKRVMKTHEKTFKALKDAGD